MSTASIPTSVATVISVSGLAFARNADGAVRRLATGDSIMEGEIVFTMADGQVELAFSDGHHATILASESYMIGPEAMVATSPDAYEASIAAAGEVGKVVTALEGQGDILEGLEAPAAGAAGAGGENSGNSFVRLLRIVEPVTPIGFEFPTNPIEEIRAPEGTVIPEQEGYPSAGAASVTLDDEGLDGIPDGVGDVPGEDVSFSGTLPFTFGPDGAGSVSLAGMALIANGGTATTGGTATVGTETVTYHWDSTTHTLTAVGPRGDLFTVQVDPTTGAYEVTLKDNVLHATLNGANGDDTENDASVVLTFTVTDSNGDSADGTVTIIVDDDTPDISANPPVDEVTLTTSDADTPGPGFGIDSKSFSSAFSFISNPGADGGTTSSVTYALDVIGTPIAEGPYAGLVDSGLRTSPNNTVIYLYEVGGVIVGSTSTTTPGTSDGLVDTTIAFTLSVDGSGNVELKQYQAMEHTDVNPADDGAEDYTNNYDFTDDTEVLGNNLVVLKASQSITDSDGDTKTATGTLDLGGNIVFTDVGPNISANTPTDTITLTTSDADTPEAGFGTDSKSFSGAFTFNTTAGADTATTSSVAYALDVIGTPIAEGPYAGLVDSGLRTSPNNTVIYLYEVGGVIVGSTSTTTPGTSDGLVDTSIAFTLSVDVSGNVQLNQYQAMEHTDVNPADDGPEDYSEDNDFTDDTEVLGNNLVVLTATQTITDGDGDTKTATGTLDLGGNIIFTDVGPDAVDDNILTFPEDPEGGISTSGNVLSNDLQGADGAVVTHISLDGGETWQPITSGTPVADGFYQFVVAGVGTYTFKANGQWTFSSNADVTGLTDASFYYRITDGDGDTDQAVQPIFVTDVIPSTAYITVNTSNTGGGGATGNQQFEVIITNGHDTLAKTATLQDEEGQQDIPLTFDDNVQFEAGQTYTVVLDHLSGSAHVNVTDFSITTSTGDVITLNGKGGNNNTTLIGNPDGTEDEDTSWDGVIYNITGADDVNDIQVSDPIGYDVNTISSGTLTGGKELVLQPALDFKDDFTLDFEDLPAGSNGSGETDLFGVVNKIDISGDDDGENTQSDNSITINPQDVLDLGSGGNHTVYITGDAVSGSDVGDKVMTDGGWSSAGTVMLDGVTYDSYTATVGLYTVTLNIEQGLDKTGF